MEKTRIWNVPEGYELDKEQSSERQVVLRKIEDKRISSWEEYCELMKGKDSCFVDMNGNVRSSHFLAAPIVEEFEDKEDAVTFAAYSKLLKMRKQWLGGWEPDWTDEGQIKHTIYAKGNKVEPSESLNLHRSMSFPTIQMRDEFFNTFRDLLEIAKPLL